LLKKSLKLKNGIREELISSLFLKTRAPPPGEGGKSGLDIYG
jgi:hypothetical protein